MRYIIIIILLFIIGCSLDDLFLKQTFSEFSSLPSWNQQENIINNEEFFYVKLKDATTTNRDNPVFDFLMYEKDGSVGTDCKIPKEFESTEDIYCMIEVMELDLHFHKMILEFNAPSGMCAYLSYSPHWHYNKPTKKGYPELTKEPALKYCHCIITAGDSKPSTKICSAPDDCEANDFSIFDSCSISDSPYECKNKAGDKSQYCVNSMLCKNSLKELCNGDSNEDKCCYGDYTVDEGDQETEGEWGSFTRCIGGLGRTDWDAYDDEGKPIEISESAESGHITTYEIDSVYNKMDGTPNNFITANYYEGIEDKTNLPTFYKPEDNSVIGQPFLSVACLDKAWEIKHRINIIIREWNTKAEFLKFKDSNGSRGDSDIAGHEGVECDYYEQSANSVFNDPCGDIKDVDDIKTTSGYPEISYPDDDDE